MNIGRNVMHSLLLACVIILSFASTQAKAMPTFSIKNPVLLQVAKQEMVQLIVTPQQAIYQTMPQVSLAYYGNKAIKLHWQAKNGFGVELASGIAHLDTKTQRQNILLPEGHGYYAISLRAQNIVQHYSFGILPAMLQKQNDIFGVWVQGETEYSDLGVSWTRVPIVHQKWNDKRYRKHLHTTLTQLKQRGIKVLLYPKDLPESISTSRYIIRNNTKAWNILEQWLTEIVQEFDGEVAVWGLINEPFAYVLWKVPNELTLRYWKMMRSIIDKHSPNTPLIGPSLNVHKKGQLRQYRELMQAGFGKLVDGIELHTYMRNVSHKGKKFDHAMPEDIDWNARMRQALLDAGNGKIKHDIWITEMGMPANYEQELEQAAFVTRTSLWAKYMLGNGVPIRMLLWHAFSYPQGNSERSRNYSLFRNSKVSSKKRTTPSPQARPAAIAYGTSIRYLNGATFVRQWDNLPAQTYAFEFKNQDKKVVALWTTQTRASVRIPKQVRQGTLSDMFGQQLPMPQQGKLQVKGEPIWIEYK